MRQAVLPENFRCPQQDELFAFLDDVFEHGPQIAMVTAPPGTGKSHGLRLYREAIGRRWRQRQEQRRVIDLAEVHERFKAQGFDSAEDEAWLRARLRGVGKRDRFSEVELVHILKEREAALDPEDKLGFSMIDLPPCPRVAIVTPSQTSSEAAMLALLAEAASGKEQRWFSAFSARHTLMEELTRWAGNWLIIVDEAQRLKIGPLNLLREIYDDGGATLVLAGTPDLEASLMCRGAESLFSRVALHYRMEPLSAEQVEKLLPGWEARLVRRIYAHTGGIFRRIENLVRLCEQIRAVNEEPRVTVEILDEAVRHIPDLLPGDVKGRAAAAAQAATSARAELVRPARGAAAAAPGGQAAVQQAVG